MDDPSIKRYLAEMVGTFALVFFGVGAAVVAGEQIGAIGVGLAFGLTLLAMIYVIGPISGCHINPAVTLGVLLSRKIEPKPAGFYMVAQCVGAIVAAGLVWWIASDAPGGYDLVEQGLASNGYDDHSPGGYGLTAALLSEALLTGFLVLTVLGATSRRAPVGFAGVAIGLVLWAIHMVNVPITNTSVNPARSLGTAVFVGDWALSQLWVFIIAPLVGGVLAAGVWRALEVDEDEPTVAQAERALPSEQRERAQAPERRRRNRR